MNVNLTYWTTRNLYDDHPCEIPQNVPELKNMSVAYYQTGNRFVAGNGICRFIARYPGIKLKVFYDPRPVFSLRGGIHTHFATRNVIVTLVGVWVFCHGVVCGNLKLYNILLINLIFSKKIK